MHRRKCCSEIAYMYIIIFVKIHKIPVFSLISWAFKIILRFSWHIYANVTFQQMKMYILQHLCSLLKVFKVVLFWVKWMQSSRCCCWQCVFRFTCCKCIVFWQLTVSDFLFMQLNLTFACFCILLLYFWGLQAILKKVLKV